MAEPSVLAALVSPWLFYAGSAAVSIPVIIHLLAKRRYKRVRWAALDFLILAEKQNRRKINLQQLILLALRCLAIFLLGLMLARPYFPPSGLAGVLGASANRERIFVLDDSFSMAYRQGTASTFDDAKAALVELLEWCHKQSPRDKVTILLTSAPDERIADGRILADGDLPQLIAEVEALRPAHQPARFAELLVQLNDELQQSPDRLDTAVYIISDFQKKDWTGGSGSPKRRVGLDPPATRELQGGSRTAPHVLEEGVPRLCPLAAVADWPEQERDLDIFLVQVAGQDRPNVAVTKLTTPQPQLVTGIENRLVATIGNFSHDTIEPFEMDVFLGGASQPAIAVPAIAPGQSVDVAFDTSFPEKGFQQMRVEIPADALGADDQRMAVWQIQSAINVLLVNGEPSTTTADDEVALLRTALRPEGEVYSGFQVAVADPSELDGVNLEEVHLLMLANVYRLSDEAVDRMEDYVRQGGGLVVFLGDQVDAELYNQRLWKNGAGLLPCQLARVLSIPRGQTAPTLTGGDWTHPLMKIFGGAQNPFLSNLAFWQYFECIPIQGPGFSVQGSALSPQSSVLFPEEAPGVRVVARFSDQEHNPAIIEKSFGRGTVILFASSADVEWNNWPKRPSYPVTVQELGQHAAKPNPLRTAVLVGDPIRMTLEPARYQPEVTVRTPAYPTEAEAVINAAPTAAGGAYELLWPSAGQVGIYQLRLTRADGQQEQVLLSADLDAEESNLASCNETDLRRCAPEVDFVYTTDVSTIVGRTDATLRELWPGLLIAVVGLLMLEQTLACWFGRSS